MPYQVKDDLEWCIGIIKSKTNHLAD